MSDSSRNSLLPLIDEIKWAAEAASSKGPQGHAEVLRRINDCLLAAETPLETIYRIGHQVCDTYAYILFSVLAFSKFDLLHSHGKTRPFA